MLTTCQREDVKPLVEPQTQRLIVSADAIPQVTGTLLEKMGARDALTRFSVNDGENMTPFSIDWDRIKQLVDSTGRETYTFGLSVGDGDPATFYNLVLRYNEFKEAHQPFILKYTMAEDFVPQYLSTGSLEGFSGTVRKILINENTAIGGRRGNAALGGGGISLGDPCPNDTPIGPGGGGGGGSPDPGGGGSWGCTTYMIETTWYSQVCDASGCGDPVVTGVDYSFETECGWTNESNSGMDNACRPEVGEIPILEPIWPENLLLFQDRGEEIKDIANYLKCFDQSKPASLTLYVDQPKPGKRDTWSGWALNPNVGHTFISIQQGDYTRVVGFYPNSGVNPYRQPPSATSALLNDEGHEYDVSISSSLTSAQLMSLLSYIQNFPGTYNLNDYNCTDFGIGCYLHSGLSVPDTKGTWPGGGGSNPGDLGEDLRGVKSSGHTVVKTKGTAVTNSGKCN